MGRIVQARLDAHTLDVLVRLRRRTGLTESEILRRGIHRLAQDTVPSRKGRIVGVGRFASRIRDLATNPKHRRGFGRS